jgi:hypothetical protein
MPDFNQFSYPANFFERTSSTLLTAPRPQFVYAHGLLGALALSLDTGNLDGSFFGTGHTSSGAPSAGAPFGPLENQALKLYDGTLSQIFSTPLEEGFVGQPGTVVHFNRPKYDSTTYTWTSRNITPRSTISTSPIAPSAEQTTLALQLLGGPYDSANSCIGPYGLDKFTAQVGVHKMTDIVGEYMKYDFHKTLEAGVTSLGDLATKIYPTPTMTSVNDIAVANGGPFSVEMIARVGQTMDDANLPTFPDGYRLMVLPPIAFYHLSGDPSFAQARYFPELNIVNKAYVTSIRNFHLVQSTTLTSTTNTSNVTYYLGHAWAPNALGCASGIAPTVAASNNTNYGLSGLVMWQACMALALLDNRYCYSLVMG